MDVCANMTVAAFVHFKTTDMFILGHYSPESSLTNERKPSTNVGSGCVFWDSEECTYTRYLYSESRPIHAYQCNPPILKTQSPKTPLAESSVVSRSVAQHGMIQYRIPRRLLVMDALRAGLGEGQDAAGKPGM